MEEQPITQPTITDNTIHNLIQAVRDLAAQHPTRRYSVPTPEVPFPFCLHYRSPDRHNGEFACIIGEAFISLGFDTTTPPFNGTAISAIRNLKIPASNSQLLWLRVAQRAQDTGSTWEEAVKTANTADTCFQELTF